MDTTPLPVDRVVKLRSLGWKAYEIADLLNEEAGETVYAEIDIKRAWRSSCEKAATPESQAVAEEVAIEGVDYLRKYLKDTWQPIRDIRPYTGKSRLTCAVGDLHGDPEPSIVQTIANWIPNNIIIGGDLLHSEEASAHPASKMRGKRRTLKEEIGSVRAAIQFWLDHTDATIDILLGNHDRWTRRQVVESVPDYLLEFFTDPIDMLVAGLGPRVRLINTNLVFHHPNGTAEPFGDSQFLYPYGDALFSHMNFTSKLPGKAVESLARRMDDMHWQLGLPEFVLFCQFHGHKISQNRPRSGYRVLVEPGMGGRMGTEGYKVDYEAKWDLGGQGFLVFEQRQDGSEWKTVRESVQIIQPNL